MVNINNQKWNEFYSNFDVGFGITTHYTVRTTTNGYFYYGFTSFNKDDPKRFSPFCENIFSTFVIGQ